MKYPHAQVLIFAKQPISGAVKTRLIPAIGVDAATRLHCAMTRRVGSMVSTSELAAFRFAVAGDARDALFTEFQQGLTPICQVGEDLGERMRNAAKQAFDDKRVQTETVILIGADCPTMGANHLEEALGVLESGVEVVFVPAADGGYVLVGMRRVVDELFRDIAWGTSEVLSMSLEKLSEAGVSTQCLAPLWDVDTAEDLPKLASLEPPLDW
jgi:rSAM/selenodomain-associated transferase 1